jgi:hypothetical protein
VTKRAFDKDKCLEVLLYLNRYLYTWYAPSGLCLYYADKYHLERWGRTLCGGTYVFRDSLISHVQADGLLDELIGLLKIDGRDADMSFLSSTDVEAIYAVADVYSAGNLLDNIASDASRLVLIDGDEVSVEQIASLLPNSADVLEYLHKS